MAIFLLTGGVGIGATTMGRESSDLDDLTEALAEEPEAVRQIFIYAVCQTMVEAGMLELMGVSNAPGGRTTLLLRNPDTRQVVEVPKPPLTEEEDRAINQDILDLLSVVPAERI